MEVDIVVVGSSLFLLLWMLDLLMVIFFGLFVEDVFVVE